MNARSPRPHRCPLGAKLELTVYMDPAMFASAVESVVRCFRMVRDRKANSADFPERLRGPATLLTFVRCVPHLVISAA